jgi:hypothetical protein
MHTLAPKSMYRRPRLLIRVWATGSLFLATRALGVPPRPVRPVPQMAPVDAEADAQREEARQYFLRAISLFDEGSWDAALLEFQKSRELYPTRSAIKDEAICERMLGRFDEALQTFQEFLTAYPDLPSADRKAILREIASLEKRVGLLDIITPGLTGAEVQIDARPRGVVPGPPLHASRGEHFVRVSKKGFVPFEARLVVVAQQTTQVKAALAPLGRVGRLKVVEQSGKKVDVLVDNVLVGTTPWDDVVAVGDHTVRLRGPGDLGTPPIAAPVAQDRETALSLQAEPLDASLRVEPSPLGARVAIDGVTVGRGIWDGAVRSGHHRVEVAAEDFLPARQDVVLDHDDRKIAAVTLERDPTSPVWADKNPPKLAFEVDLAPTLNAGLGGSVDSVCSVPGCTHDHPPGIQGVARAGYQLRGPFGFSVDVGALTLNESMKGSLVQVPSTRTAPVGVRTDDGVTLRAFTLGASVSVRLLNPRFPLTVRLGLGVVLARTGDTRAATIADPTSAAYAASHFPRQATLVEEQSGLAFLYAAPEVRQGLRLGDRFEISIGIAFNVMLATSDTSWRNLNTLSGAQGDGLFAADRYLGRAVVAYVPGLGVRYDMRAPF